MKRFQSPSLRSSMVVALFFTACGPALAQQATVPPACSMRFIAELSPDVPNPRDNGFLSSLLGEHGGFSLYLQHIIDNTHLDLLLVGPGPRRNCREVLDSMRKDSRIQSIEISQ